VHIFLATPMFSQNSQPSMTFHDHPNIFWIAHAGLAQLPDRHQKEPQCFQESRRTRCQWPMSWLHVHKKNQYISGLKFLDSNIVWTCLDCITTKSAR
jgi:hypothetical protein